jgi:hypothetical protein
MTTTAPTPVAFGGNFNFYTKESNQTDDTNLFSLGNILSILEYEARELSNSIINNPRMIETPTDSRMEGPLFIKLIQWVDNRADIVDGDDLEFTMDGATVKVKAQLNLTNPVNGVAYEDRFGGNTYKVSDNMSVTTIDSGQLLIWLE